MLFGCFNQYMICWSKVLIYELSVQYVQKVVEERFKVRERVTLTWGQLHPCTDPVDVPGVAKEEQAEADHGANYQQHGGPYEEHGSPEGWGGDGGEVQQAALTDELRGQRVSDAVVEEAKVTGLRGVDAVPDPVGLDEDHHGDDDEADGEHGPQNADCPRVSHIVGVVDFGCLLCWKQIHVFKLPENLSEVLCIFRPVKCLAYVLKCWVYSHHSTHTCRSALKAVDQDSAPRTAPHPTSLINDVALMSDADRCPRCEIFTHYFVKQATHLKVSDLNLA